MSTSAPNHSSDAASPFNARAARVHAFGGVDAIDFEDVDLSPPEADEVVVHVKAAGVGPWDGWIRAGKSALPQPLPLTLGSDLSGVVEAVGSDVTLFKPGDEVFGVTNPRFVGAYATRTVAKANMLAMKPPSLSHVDAASVPVIAVTAWQALFDQAKLERGQHVLIHGAAGNVGTYAVQLAHQAGLRVTATMGSDDVEFVRSLGADMTIDYRATPFETEFRDVDAVIDLVGGDMQARSFTVLKRGGSLISAVSQPDQALAERHGVRAAFFLVAVGTDVLTRIAETIKRRELQARVGTVLPFADARIAHEMLEGARPHPRGKIVLQIEQ